MEINEKTLLINGFVLKEDEIMTRLFQEDGVEYAMYEYMATDDEENPFDSVSTFFIRLTKNLTNSIGRDWNLHIDNNTRCTVASADIQTVEQFNKMMEIMDIKFKMAEK